MLLLLGIQYWRRCAKNIIEKRVAELRLVKHYNNPLIHTWSKNNRKLEETPIVVMIQCYIIKLTKEMYHCKHRVSPEVYEGWIHDSQCILKLSWKCHFSLRALGMTSFRMVIGFFQVLTHRTLGICSHSLLTVASMLGLSLGNKINIWDINTP